MTQLSPKLNLFVLVFKVGWFHDAKHSVAHIVQKIHLSINKREKESMKHMDVGMNKKCWYKCKLLVPFSYLQNMQWMP